MKSAEVQLVDNAPHGRAVEYFVGTTQVARELTFERGVQAGPQRQLNRNGTLERASTYVANKPHGEIKEQYANGAKRALLRYENGTPAGTHTYWYPTGRTELEGSVRRQRAGASRSTKTVPAGRSRQTA